MIKSIQLILLALVMVSFGCRSDEKGSASNKPIDDRPTDRSEGFPGFLTGAEDTEVTVLRADEIEIQMGPGTVQTKSTEDDTEAQLLQVNFWLVEQEQIDLVQSTGKSEVTLEGELIASAEPNEDGSLEAVITLRSQKKMVIQLTPDEPASDETSFIIQGIDSEEPNAIYIQKNEDGTVEARDFSLD